MICLYSYSGSADHGCETAARAAKQVLTHPMRLYSQHVEEEYQYKMHELMDVGKDSTDNSPRKGRRFTIARLQTKFQSPEEKDMFFRKQEMLSAAKEGDIWLCMDEDAYCRTDADCYCRLDEESHCGSSEVEASINHPINADYKNKDKNKSINRIFISSEDLDKILKGVPVTSAGSGLFLENAENEHSVASEQRAVRAVLSARGAKTVLWNCAVDASLLDNVQVINDLKSYDLIAVSESITYETVRRLNANVLQTVDPAFLLPPAYRPLPQGWKEGHMIGLQISAAGLEAIKAHSDSGRAKEMLYSNEILYGKETLHNKESLRGKEILRGKETLHDREATGTLDSARKTSAQNKISNQLVPRAIRHLIDKILTSTDCSIVLIPYTVRVGADDRAVLAQVYDQYSDTGRVVLLDDCSCMDLKGYISQCRIFVGMHTQAAIAAWSSGVPSMIISDAVKAKGIARDLFGDETHYVLPLAAGEQKFCDAFGWIFKREESLRMRMKERLPDYTGQIKQIKKAIDELTG